VSKEPKGKGIETVCCENFSNLDSVGFGDEDYQIQNHSVPSPQIGTRFQVRKSFQVSLYREGKEVPAPFQIMKFQRELTKNILEAEKRLLTLLQCNFCYLSTAKLGLNQDLYFNKS